MNNDRKIITTDKVCCPKKRIEVPNRYLRKELISKIRKLGMSKKEAEQLSYKELCKKLDIKYIELDLLEKKSKIPTNKISTGKDCISRSNIILKQHQKRVVEILNEKRGLIAIHSTGSGKTLTAVAASQCFLDQNPDNKVIVITPTSLQANFKKEMRDYGININDDRYIFYTFQSFSRTIDRKEFSNSNKLFCKNNMLIIDEAHNLRTIITEKQGKYASDILSCAIKAKKVLLLTATPVVNSLYDMANLIAMIDGKQQMTKTEYKNMIEDTEQFKKYFGRKISIFSPDQKELKKYYPDFKNNEVFLDMSPSFYKLYKKLEKGIGGNLFDSESDLNVFYNGVRRGSNKIDDEIPSIKLKWIMNKIKESEIDDKFVIFSHFLDSGIKLVMNSLDEAKIPHGHIDGSMSKKIREKTVDQYNKNNYKVLLISKAGGEGLDLKSTRHIIILEPSWNESTHKQVIGRAIRYESHEMLPIEKRFVDIWRLYIIKPEEREKLDVLLRERILKIKNQGFFQKFMNFIGLGKKFKRLSVDLFLRNFVLVKQEKIDEFMKSLKEISIENKKP